MLPPSVAKWQNSLSLQACPELLSTRSVLVARILYLLWPLCCQSKMSSWIQAGKRICLRQQRFIKNLPRKQVERTTLQRFYTSTDNVIQGWLSDIHEKIPGDDVVEWEYTLCCLKEAWWVRHRLKTSIAIAFFLRKETLLHHVSLHPGPGSSKNG